MHGWDKTDLYLVEPENSELMHRAVEMAVLQSEIVSDSFSQKCQ